MMTPPTSDFFSATPATRRFVSRGILELVNKNRNDLNLRGRNVKVAETLRGPESSSPLDGYHSALLPEPRLGVCQSTTKYSYAVVHSTRVSVQDLLCNERPAIDLFSYFLRNCPSPLMGDMNVSRLSRALGWLRCRSREGWNSDALV
jgi:hypothetical protein